MNLSKTENSENHFVQVLRRWWWLIVLAPLLAGAVSYLLNRNEPNIFEAEAQMLIGPGLDSANPDLNSLRTSGFLMQTYKKMASTDTFLQSVIDDLKINLSLNQLRGMIDLNTDPNSLILTIDVQSQDPNMAIKVANAVAKELLNMSPTNPNNPATIALVQNRAQADTLDGNIKQSQAKLSALESELQGLDGQANPASDPKYQTLAATESWVKYLESEYQKQTSVTAQSQMGDQILNELAKNSQARITDLESELQKTDPDLQQLVLPQIDAENNHLSALQKTLLENQQPVEGQPLDEYIQSIETGISAYQEKYAFYFDVNNQRFISDQIAAERNRLLEAEKIAADRRLQVFSMLSEELGRLSVIKNLPISEKLEKRRLLSDQITAESTSLTTLQNSRAALSDALLKSWTNEVQITQLASTTTQVPSNLQLIVLMACIAGLAAATAIALAIAYFDNSAQNTKDMELALNAPVLGRILPASSTHSSPPLLGDQTDSQGLALLEAGDEYRLMAVKMLYRLDSNNYSIIEGGNGKKAGRANSNGSNDHLSHLPQTILISDLFSDNRVSEIAAKFAMVLAQTGKRVLLVDSNLSEIEITELFGPDTINGESISLTSEDTPVGLLAVPSMENLFILPEGPIHSDQFGSFGPAPAAEVISSLKKFASYILFVGSNLMTSPATFGLASRVDGVILVVPDTGLKREQLASLSENVKIYKWQIIGSVAVSGQTYLQHILNESELFSKISKGIFHKGSMKIRTSMLPRLNQKRAIFFGKLRNTLRKKSETPEKEHAFEESNRSG